MSWSLEVHHGDLTLGGTKLGTVTGTNKLVQDLRHFILEKMGSDQLHPEYGSLLDGGVRPDGSEPDPILGESNMRHAAVLIESELRRIIAAYQAQQLERAKADRLLYNKTTLTAEEILTDVSAINFAQNMDTLDVELTLVTAAGASRPFVLPLKTSPVFTP